MKKALVLLACVAFSSACSSSDGFIENSSRHCAPGDPIVIEAALDPETSIHENLSTSVKLLVRVTNNSDQEIEVRSIHVDQPFSETSRYVLDGASREYTEVIPEGELHTFELLSSIRSQPPRDVVMNRRLEVSVTVALVGGETYRCRFLIA